MTNPNGFYRTMREREAEDTLYAWACDRVTPTYVHEHLGALGYRVDLRKGDANMIPALDLENQREVEFFV